MSDIIVTLTLVTLTLVSIIMLLAFIDFNKEGF